MKRLAFLVLALLVLVPAAASAQKVYLNPSDQTSNPVAGGGNEAQYAIIYANIAEGVLDGAGFNAKVDQDFYNSPYNANSWGADIFVSIHTNAGGGHGTETLYLSNGGKTLANAVQNGLLSKLPYQSRGLKYRDNLHVLNATDMYACLTEAVFHDCATTSGYAGHPPSESAFLKSSDGQNKIGNGIAAGVCSYYGKSCQGGITPKKGFYKGVVYKNPDQNDRIAGATVKLSNGLSTTSSATGFFEFEVEEGTYTATASMAGYQSNTSTKTVLAGTEVWGSIGLTPNTTPQKGLYKGVVYKDPDSNDRIAGASVSLSNGLSTTSSSTGFFEFSVDAGTYTATATASGYKPGSSTKTVPAGGEIWGSIGLTPVVTPPPDKDKDGVPDASDNCPNDANPDQKDTDKDGP
ncbi:MAG: carboxypeptidase regulatory-like domain-containing protein, partial [Deltaproteobacteria bacterium]|nr:carboxypeptidase regulatory-like domain-containing protein [Deltaproteobacteria bacterium]